MKTPTDMKQFLVHPEQRIRRFALDYFEEAQSSDDELLPLVLQACDMEEQTKDRRLLLTGAREFTVTPTVAFELGSRLKEEPALGDSYARILLSAHPHVLAEATESFSGLPPELVRSLDRRIGLVHLPTAELIEEWGRFAESIRGEDYDSIDFSLVIAMARELSRRSDFPELDLSNSIRKYEIDATDESEEWYEGYEDVMACVLAGYLQDESAIAALADVLNSDVDLLQERAMYSLSRIGTRKVVEAIEERFRESEWDFHNYASGVLSGIKTSDSETATLRLFHQAPDTEERLMLADTLCRLTSETEIPAMKDLLQQSDDNLDLMEALYGNCVVNGIDDPEVRTWKDTLDEVDAAFERQMRFEAAVAKREKKKVGRNEPCPCGSGKKYKKCCGA